MSSAAKRPDATAERWFPVSVPLAIKTYDIDAAGIVSNIVYIRWLEDLRIVLLGTFIDWEAHLREGFGPVLTRTAIDYRRPLRLADAPVGQMWVEDLARSRWRVGAEFTVGQRVVAAAQQEGYWVDMRGVRPAPLPAAIQQRWASRAAPTAPAVPDSPEQAG